MEGTREQQSRVQQQGPFSVEQMAELTRWHNFEHASFSCEELASFAGNLSDPSRAQQEQQQPLTTLANRCWMLEWTLMIVLRQLRCMIKDNEDAQGRADMHGLIKELAEKSGLPRGPEYQQAMREWRNCEGVRPRKGKGEGNRRGKGSR